MSGDLVVNAEVGIGRSPTSTYKLDVHGEVNNNWLTHIHNTHATAGYGVKIRAGDDNNVSAFRVSSQDNATTILDALGGGAVTTPNNPSFWMQAANVGASDYSGGSIIFIGGGVNSNTISDIGSNFSTSTGRFTAPVSGVYHFSAVVRIDSFGGSYSYLTLWDSGSVAFARDLTSITTTYYTHTVAASRYLSANDYVYCHFTTTADTSTTISSDSYFSGHLVG